MESSHDKKFSRRDILKGAAAVAGGLMGGEALAQGKKQEYPPGYEEMLKAARELHELGLKEKERREAKPFRDALDAQKRILKQQGNNNPRHSEYQDALVQKFGISDWTSEEGQKISRYLNDWYNEDLLK